MYFILFFVLFQFNFVNLKIKFKLHCNSGEQRKAKKKRNFFSLPSKRNQFSSKTFSFVLSIKKQRKEWKNVPVPGQRTYQTMVKIPSPIYSPKNSIKLNVRNQVFMYGSLIPSQYFAENSKKRKKNHQHHTLLNIIQLRIFGIKMRCCRKTFAFSLTLYLGRKSDTISSKCIRWW